MLPDFAQKWASPVYLNGVAQGKAEWKKEIGYHRIRLGSYVAC